jgi:hypothetical protein
VDALTIQVLGKIQWAFPGKFPDQIPATLFVSRARIVQRKQPLKRLAQLSGIVLHNHSSISDKRSDSAAVGHDHGCPTRCSFRRGISEILIL